ncbi:MAG TPA: nucleotidyl transferase AbiEii/AbiGii toxin family protein, partial [Thermoleophilia bacterium]|nr:nucleotidyl transferase AbiEii/AbiGii toxin family protein [Thermoleophilia bacterium]
MADVFLLLDDDERRKILVGAAQQLGRSAQALEKDVWVCWALEQLWTTPKAVKMAFKGGTSLSKVYDAIERFSEDVDVTLDYRSLDPEFDPFADGISNNKLKKAGERLRTLVTSHVHDVVVPHLRARLTSVSADAPYAIEVSADGEEVRIKYRSVVDAPDGYIADSVLLEFGGRNITDPNEKHTVTPYISTALEDVTLPSATVDVLVGGRTFWEKATLMHVECSRKEFKSGAERMSRHWCDLYKLADHPIGRSAVGNRALLADVIKHKKV